MIALTSTTRQLELDLASASSVALDIIVTFKDIRYADQATNVGSQVSSSNGTTDVVICASPTSGVLRLIDAVSVCNRDNTATETIRVYYDDGGTETDIIQIDLTGGDNLFYEDGNGWNVLSSSGTIKQGPGSSTVSVTTNNFSGDNSTVNFTLTTAPASENQTWAYISGVYQQKDTYSISGTTFTFSTAPPTGTSNVEINYVSNIDSVTPANSSVTSAMIVDATIVTGDIASGGTFTLATEQASTSGTAIDFTSLPSGIKMIIVMFVSVSTNSTSQLQIRLGDVDGFDATGYTSVLGVTFDGGTGDAASAVTTGFPLTSTSVAAANYSGQYILTLEDSSDNTWLCQGMCGRTDGTAVHFHTVGLKAMSAVLDRIRITSVTPDTFDAGSINIMYK